MGVGRKVTLNLDAQTDGQLAMLSEALGFSREMAAVYAIGLVHACVREGLIFDVPVRAWPKEARRLTGGSGRVIAFDAMREKSAKENS